MSDQNYRPTGNLEGDNRKLPNKGVNTAVTDTYGGNLNQGYQSEGKITSDTKSDGMIQGGLSKNKR